MSTRYVIATLREMILPMRGGHPLACRGNVRCVKTVTAEEYEAAVIDSHSTTKHKDGSVMRVTVTGKYKQEL